MPLPTRFANSPFLAAAARLDGIFVERAGPAAGSSAEQLARMQADARRAAGGAGLTEQLG